MMNSEFLANVKQQDVDDNFKKVTGSTMVMRGSNERITMMGGRQRSVSEADMGAGQNVT